jgi:Spy/CpxP family protein refolding chaperone
MIMKTLASAFVALAVLAGAVAPAMAAPQSSDEPFDAKAFFQHLEDRGG